MYLYIYVYNEDNVEKTKIRKLKMNRSQIFSHLTSIRFEKTQPPFPSDLEEVKEAQACTST